MGYWTGRVGPLSTGSNTLTTGLTGAPTGCRITIGGKSSGDTVNHGCVGTSDGTRQNVQHWSPTVSGTSNTQIIFLKDGTGTTQLDGAWTAFGTSGSAGTVSITVATNTAGFLPTLEVWN